MSYLIDTPRERRKLALLALSFFFALMLYELVAMYYIRLPLGQQLGTLGIIAFLIVMVLRRRK